MEQDRTPAVFLYLVKLARGAIARLRTVVHLIAKTTTAKGLKVTCRLDRRKYPTGREVSNAQIEHRNLERNKFPGEWNYVIKPNGEIS